MFSFIRRFAFDWVIFEIITYLFEIIAEKVFGRSPGNVVVKIGGVNVLEYNLYSPEAKNAFKARDKKFFTSRIKQYCTDKDIQFFKSFIGQADYFGFAVHIRILIFFSSFGGKEEFEKELTRRDNFKFEASVLLNNSFAVSEMNDELESDINELLEEYDENR